VIAGLILAAGEGRRYGRDPKLLADLAGRPVLEHAIEAQCAVAELERIVVVLGARARQISETVDFMRAQPVVCERWQDGVSASLRCGCEALSNAARVLVTLGDEPLVTSEIIRTFLDAPPGTRAIYGGRPGHPVVLGPEHMQAIRTITGDRGARELLRGGPTIDCGTSDPHGDVDTPTDLAALRSQAGPRG
jgi:molybdenum cofactor cytidylyltransferase